jgi:ABC-type transport system involved in multi-copper enzyme maturation permease subunit
VIWRIARRELLEHVRSTRFFVLSILCVLLLPATTYVNASRMRARELFAQELDAGRTLGMDPEGSQGDFGATRFGWRSGVVAHDPALRAIRHPAPAEVITQGAAGSIPIYWQFSTEGLVEGPPADAEERQASGVTAMDVTSVIEMVLGLLAILIGFDSVSGELESGRMRTILAHPVSRAEVLFGKFAGALLSLAAPLVVGLLASYGVLWLRGMPVFEGRFLAILAGTGLASVLYLATMLALSIAVSALTRESRTSLVVLLLIWICATLAIPSGAALAADALSPVQPLELMRASVAENIRHLERERARSLAETWESVSGARDLPADGTISPDVRARYVLARQLIEERLTGRKRQVIESLESARERQRERRARLEIALGRLSPAVTFLRAATSMAGTGRSMRTQWMDEARAEQRALETASFDRQFGVELFDANLDYLRVIYWPNASDPLDRVPDYDALPDFAHHDRPLIELFAEAAPDLCLLAVECVTLILAASIAYTRLDV